MAREGQGYPCWRRDIIVCQNLSCNHNTLKNTKYKCIMSLIPQSIYSRIVQKLLNFLFVAQLSLFFGLIYSEIKTFFSIISSSFKGTGSVLPQRKCSALTILSGWGLQLPLHTHTHTHTHTHIYIYIYIYFLTASCKNLISPWSGCQRGITVKVMDCGVVVSEFELKSP